MKRIPFDILDVEAVYNELILLYQATKTELGLPRSPFDLKEVRNTNIPFLFDYLAYKALTKLGMEVKWLHEVTDCSFLLVYLGEESVLYGFEKHFDKNVRLTDGSSGEAREMAESEISALFPESFNSQESAFAWAALYRFVIDVVDTNFLDKLEDEKVLTSVSIDNAIFNESFLHVVGEPVTMTTGHGLTFTPISFSIDKDVLKTALERFKGQASFGVINIEEETIPIGKLINWSIDETDEDDPSYLVSLGIQWTKRASEINDQYGGNTHFIPLGNAIVGSNCFAPAIHFTSLDNIALVFDEGEWWSV